MISSKLLTALTTDLYPTDSSSPRYLVALIDMATMPEETQKKLASNPLTRLQPLILAPGLEKLQPLGAHLVCPREATRRGHNALIDSLAPYDSNTIVAWITSAVSADVLAQHLSQATLADTENGERYLLRYYDSRVTPVLLHHAPRPWREWFLSPVVSWWMRGATPSHEQWLRIHGGARSTPTIAPPLVIGADLWWALNNDPLPHRILETLNEASPAVFSSPCNGVRLAMIESLLTEGKKLGLVDHDDLIDFVIVRLQNTAEQLQQQSNWHAALQRSVKGEGRLSQLYQHGVKRP